MSKRQEMREKRRQQEKMQRYILIVLVVIGALLVAAALIYPSLKPVGDIATVEANPRPQAKFNGMGDPNAPVKIIEFSDFQCPYCKRFSDETEKQIVDTYVATGKVYFEYRSFGEFIGVESRRAAEAAYCAGDQNKFWEMHDIIFANQNGENKGAFIDRRLQAFAEKVGVDMVTFNDCFTSGKYSKLVDQDGAAGQQAGVQATPSFTVNGQLVEGAQPFSEFQKIIEAELKKLGK